VLRHCDPIGFFEIARLAENLDVFHSIATAFIYWDDMVKMQFSI